MSERKGSENRKYPNCGEQEGNTHYQDCVQCGYSWNGLKPRTNIPISIEEEESSKGLFNAARELK